MCCITFSKNKMMKLLKAFSSLKKNFNKLIWFVEHLEWNIQLNKIYEKTWNSILPTHGLSHNRRCHPRHSYNCCKSEPWQAHVVLNGVPRIPNNAIRQLLALPAHFFVTLSTAQDCSYNSKRDLGEIKL